MLTKKLVDFCQVKKIDKYFRWYTSEATTRGATMCNQHTKNIRLDFFCKLERVVQKLSTKSWLSSANDFCVAHLLLCMQILQMAFYMLRLNRYNIYKQTSICSYPTYIFLPFWVPSQMDIAGTRVNKSPDSLPLPAAVTGAVSGRYVPSWFV